MDGIWKALSVWRSSYGWKTIRESITNQIQGGGNALAWGSIDGNYFGRFIEISSLSHHPRRDMEMWRKQKFVKQNWIRCENDRSTKHNKRKSNIKSKQIDNWCESLTLWWVCAWTVWGRLVCDLYERCNLNNLPVCCVFLFSVGRFPAITNKYEKVLTFWHLIGINEIDLVLFFFLG